MIIVLEEPKLRQETALLHIVIFVFHTKHNNDSVPFSILRIIVQNALYINNQRISSSALKKIV